MIQARLYTVKQIITHNYQGNHQNFNPSLILKQLWLMFIGMKQKKFFFSKANFKMADSKTDFFKMFNSQKKSWIVPCVGMIGAIPWLTKSWIEKYITPYESWNNPTRCCRRSFGLLTQVRSYVYLIQDSVSHRIGNPVWFYNRTNHFFNTKISSRYVLDNTICLLLSYSHTGLIDAKGIDVAQPIWLCINHSNMAQ